MAWPPPEWVTLIGAIVAVLGTLTAAIGVYRGSQEQTTLTRRSKSKAKTLPRGVNDSWKGPRRSPA